MIAMIIEPFFLAIAAIIWKAGLMANEASRMRTREQAA